MEDLKKLNPNAYQKLLAIENQKEEGLLSLLT